MKSNKYLLLKTSEGKRKEKISKTNLIGTKSQLLLLIFLIIIAGAFFYLTYFNRCGLPIEYDIGNIDSRFNVSEEEAIEYAKKAAEKWNQGLNKNVLIYKKGADMKINFVYDYRQENLDRLKSEMSSLDISDASISEARTIISNNINQYEIDLQIYNNKVAYWNSVGGAPTATYNALKDEKAELEQRRQELTAAIKLLDNEINTYNQNLSELQNEINDKKGTTEIQGVYKGHENLINIYTFGDIDELKVVITHELGHAIGADHAEDPESIMYYLIESQDYSKAILTNEDLRLVRDACGI